MRFRSSPVLAGFAAALALPLAARAAAAPPPPAGHSTDACFLSRDWDGWSAPGDGDVLYLRVRHGEIWRVDLTPGSHARKAPDYFLVNRVRGSSWICSPLDLDLTLADHQGFRMPLLAKGLRRLTAAEVAAIPKTDLP